MNLGWQATWNIGQHGSIQLLRAVRCTFCFTILPSAVVVFLSQRWIWVLALCTFTSHSFVGKRKANKWNEAAFSKVYHWIHPCSYPVGQNLIWKSKWCIFKRKKTIYCSTIVFCYVNKSHFPPSTCCRCPLY